MFLNAVISFPGKINACSKSPCSHFCYNTGEVTQPYTCGCPDGVDIDPNNPNLCGEFTFTSRVYNVIHFDIA